MATDESLNTEKIEEIIKKYIDSYTLFLDEKNKEIINMIREYQETVEATRKEIVNISTMVKETRDAANNLSSIVEKFTSTVASHSEDLGQQKKDLLKEIQRIIPKVFYFIVASTVVTFIFIFFMFYKLNKEDKNFNREQKNFYQNFNREQKNFDKNFNKAQEDFNKAQENFNKNFNKAWKNF